MWKRHWNLRFDPFLGPQSVFVATNGHEEAVARLVETVEAGGRLAILRAGEGLGKSSILSRAIELVKGPGRRIARVTAPVDGSEMLAGLAEGLGVKIRSGSPRAGTWRALGDAVRLCRWQRIQVVLVVDDAQTLSAAADRLDLERLAHLDPGVSARLTILQAFREDDVPPVNDWQLAIRLAPLTCAETDLYVGTKLRAAGRDDGPFSPRSISRLYELSNGNPRGIDRLGALALMAGAVRGLEVISSEVIDGVARECQLPWAGWDPRSERPLPRHGERIAR